MFTGLIGNTAAKELLNRLVENDRVPGALLFAGPEGVGKKLFALELARMLLCPNGGCGECSICARTGVFEIPKAEKGEDFDRVFLSGHPDVGIVVPYKRNLRVGAIRELEREAYFRPFEGEKRIFIVEDADKMNDAASNALLKTLEEPPATTHLILISSRPDSLLQTIRSRCQTIRFAPVVSNEIETFLLGLGRLSKDDAVLAARVSGGSIGKAVNLDAEWFRATRDAMLRVLRSAFETGEIGRLLQTSEQINDAKNKERFEETIEILQTLVRDVFALTKGTDAAQTMNVDISVELRELSGVADGLKLSDLALEIEELLASLNVNVNRKLATDKLFVSMAG